MAEERGVTPISEIMRASGRGKYRVLARMGVPTFLLLEGGAAEVPAPYGRAVDRALSARAAEIQRRMPPAVREAWPGGIALALQTLADSSFFPPPEAPGGADPGHQSVFRALAEGRYVRVVNFHATPRRASENLEGQLSRLAENFAPVSRDDLFGLVDRGEWTHDRPGVILSFFDGFRDNHDVAAPILDRLGLIGWFFLVSGWISTPPRRQRFFAAEHAMDVPYDEGEIPADGRLALLPAEIRDLADRGHVVASHTRTHSAAEPDLTPEELAEQATGSRLDLEGISGTPVRALAWCNGVALGENVLADEALRDAGYDLLFANHAVQRVR